MPLSVTGSVLGMAHTPVKPPLAAARVPLSMSSLTRSRARAGARAYPPAGDEILAGKVADLGSLGDEVLADLGDLVTVNQDVDDTVELDSTDRRRGHS